MSESRGPAERATLGEHRELVRILSRQVVHGAEDTARALDRLIEFGGSLSLELNFDALLDQVVDAAASLGIAERVLVVLREEDTLEVVREHGEHGRRVPADDAVRISQTLVRKCLQANRIDVRSNLPNDPELSNVHSIGELKIRSSVCVPLGEGGRPFGALYLDSKKFLQPDDLSIRLLSAFAGHASLCLGHHKRLRAEQERRGKLEGEVTERWRTTLIGRSAAWKQVMKMVDIYRNHPHPILILGETGTGKELVASALRDAGAQTRSGPLVKLNCTALPENLQEAELFGTIKGAFTGAVDRPGLVELADKGTLFLDEVGDMAPSLQAKLLRFLDSGQYYRVGDPTMRTANVRIISATNRPIDEMAKSGEFREDLFYRLKGVRIDLPPLRARREDILPLADYFLRHDTLARSEAQVQLTRAAERVLLMYEWPGNVRELRRVLETALTQALFEEEAIEARHVRTAIQQSTLPGTSNPEDLPERLEDAFRATERAVLERALLRHHGNARLVATELGITRQTVYNLRRRHRISAGFGTDTE
ncbi:MAG: sigma 54-interacting transcriptional regulator [Candidatus Eisenbacteria bacterium]|uniref:Sigma 54-interacting transcriptional regulator n=1 Tax=Eiseniibacteriota bacterium TaxID=2212470 RepID=A0A956RMF2_UNCEI|nr:sigma 54-interacting transcriptional regulator [Candidatus Eisenbacteria bacterium]